MTNQDTIRQPGSPTHPIMTSKETHQPMLTCSQNLYSGEDEYLFIHMSADTFDRYLHTYTQETYGKTPTPTQREEAKTYLLRVRWWHGCTQDPNNVHVMQKPGGGAHVNVGRWQ